MNKNEPFSEYEQSMVEFARELIRIRSYSGQERELAELIQSRMERLHYDDVTIDDMGNVVGRIGEARNPSVLLDAHMDTVEVNDMDSWTKPPFEGLVQNGSLFGRGAADMKSALAATVYAGAAARQTLLENGRAVYVTSSVCEECCDGEGLYHILTKDGIRPRYVMICEPSGNRIMLGHKGKMQTRIVTHGVSAHGATPQLGKNAVFEMASIIDRVERMNLELQKHDERGSISLTKIDCTSASPNAIPNSCSIRLDRRLAFGETERDAIGEMNTLIHAKEANWVYDELRMNSWTGRKIHYRPLHEAWRIPVEHPLTALCTAAYRKAFPSEEAILDYWDFSTNAVASVALKIPTIGFGPGDPMIAHTADEYCKVNEIVEAFHFYTVFLGLF